MKGLIFTYVLCYGGAIASLIKPWYGLLIYVCFAIIKPESLWYWAFDGGSGNFSRIIAIALLAGWALHGFGNWNFRRSKHTVISLVMFWLWALASALIVATHQEQALGYMETQLKIVLPFVVGMTLIDSEQRIKQLAWVILLSQAYVALELNLAYYSGFNRLHIAGFGGMDNNCISIAMVTACGLAFFMGVHYEGWRRWLCFLCAALMAHCPMFGFSRGGMLGLIIVGIVSFLLIDKRPKHFLLFAAGVLAALMLAGPEVRERFYTAFANEEQRDESAQGRVDMWKQCLIIIQENPILGIGPDQWVFQARDRFGWGSLKEAHSLWLQTGAELGVIGVGFLLTFYLATMAKLWPMARRKNPYASEWDVAIARMVIASFIGFMFTAQFVSLEALELPYYITLIGAGTLKLRRSSQVNSSPEWALAPAPISYQRSHAAAVSTFPR